MYIEPTTTYYGPYGQQHIRRANFLILVQLKGNPQSQIRALVRKVALNQSGHFMVGIARAFNRTIYITGAYGNSGLTVDVPKSVYGRSVPLPPHLYDAWKHGGGHNSVGSEAGAMRAWANENLSALSPGGRAKGQV